MRGRHPINRGASIKTHGVAGPRTAEDDNNNRGKGRKKRREAAREVAEDDEKARRWKKKAVETIFHAALSRVRAPRSSPRARLILAGEAEDKGGTREGGEKRGSSMTISVVARSFSSDVERGETLLSSSVSILSSDSPIDSNACGISSIPRTVGRTSEKINLCILLIKIFEKEKRNPRDIKILLIDIINRQLIIVKTSTSEIDWNFNFFLARTYYTHASMIFQFYF